MSFLPDAPITHKAFISTVPNNMSGHLANNIGTSSGSVKIEAESTTNINRLTYMSEFDAGVFHKQRSNMMLPIPSGETPVNSQALL
jgi:hypothetical protein